MLLSHSLDHLTIKIVRIFNALIQSYCNSQNGHTCKPLYSRVISTNILQAGTLILIQTPRVLLSSPRRSPAIANDQGTYALFTVSKYSFQSHLQTQELRILDLISGQSTPYLHGSEVREPCWLGDENKIVWLKSIGNGSTEIWIGDVDVFEE